MKRRERKLRFSYDSSDDSDDSEDSERDPDSEDEEQGEAEKGKSRVSTHTSKSGGLHRKEKEDYEDIKSDTAEDFSDFNELIEEEVELESPKQNKSSSLLDEDYDDDYDVAEPSERDKRMMPPPAGVPGSSSSSRTPTATPQVPSTSSGGGNSEKRLETPLAAMLPSKYAGVSVTTLFPDFRPDKVLRFSRLFGPGKYSSLPHIWKNVKKRRRKRREKQLEEQNSVGGPSVSIAGLTGTPGPTAQQVPPLPLLLPPPDLHEPEERESLGWDAPYAEIPHPSMCVPDEEVRRGGFGSFKLAHVASFSSLWSPCMVLQPLLVPTYGLHKSRSRF